MKPLIAAALLSPILAFAQTVPTIPQPSIPAPPQPGPPTLPSTKSDTTSGLPSAPTLRTEDGAVAVRVSLGAPISGSRTWMGERSYPVSGLTLIPNGHLGIQGATRGWGAGASILQVFANDPAGASFCGGAMSCYVQPNDRGYAGQDGVAATIIASSRPALAERLAVSSITPAAMANGAPAVRITLTAPLSPQQAAAVVPLMKVETTAGTAGFYGYTVAAGLAYPPVSADGRTLTVDGMFNEAGAAMPAPAPGTELALDVLHQVDGLYIGTRIRDGDGIRDTHAIEGVMINNRTVPTVFSPYDPLGDVPDVNGVYMPVAADTAGGTGTGGSAFLAADTVGSPQPGTWKRGFACRNRPTAASGVTDCLVNAFATNGLHSVATTVNGGLTNNALLVQPNDLGGAVTAQVTQAGAATFRSISSNGPVSVSGPATFANLNAALSPFKRSDLPARDCTPGNVVFVRDGRNTRLDGGGPPTGVPAFCNTSHQWIALTTGLAVTN